MTTFDDLVFDLDTWGRERVARADFPNGYGAAVYHTGGVYKTLRLLWHGEGHHDNPIIPGFMYGMTSADVTAALQKIEALPEVVEDAAEEEGPAVPAAEEHSAFADKYVAGVLRRFGDNGPPPGRQDEYDILNGMTFEDISRAMEGKMLSVRVDPDGRVRFEDEVGEMSPSELRDKIDAVPSTCPYATPVEVPGVEAVEMMRASRCSGERGAVREFLLAQDEATRAAIIRHAQRVVREVPVCRETGLPVEITAGDCNEGFAQRAYFLCPHCSRPEAHNDRD